jgi:hypothetical protein
MTMTRTKAAVLALGAGFVLIVVDGVRERMEPLARGAGLVPTAVAAGGSCAAARLDDLEDDWVVRSTSCTDCKQDHVQVGDLLSFRRDLSGALAFSLDVRPGKADRAASKTVGYALESDGVGNASGPIVLGHSTLDGTPLQLHWLIVKIRRYDADGLGDCRLRARIQVCDEEPARGAGACSSQQHGGEIHADLF